MAQSVRKYWLGHISCENQILQGGWVVRRNDHWIANSNYDPLHP